MKVKNMTSPKGNKVANQFVISDDLGNTFFQSYKSIIVKKCADGRIFLDETFWNWSATTAKYRREFLGEGIADTNASIKNGAYILTDLNSTKAVA